MRVGPAYMGLVSTDTAGVPTGGRYGNVEWFEKEAAKHGLLLAWSRIWNCFAIYTRPGPCRFVGQDLCMRQDTQEPVALCRDYFNLVMWLWNHAEKQTHETVAASLNRLRAEEKDKMQAERQAWSDDVRSEAISNWNRRTGRLVPVHVDMGANTYGIHN